MKEKSHMEITEYSFQEIENLCSLKSKCDFDSRKFYFEMNLFLSKMI